MKDDDECVNFASFFLLSFLLFSFNLWVFFFNLF